MDALEKSLTEVYMKIRTMRNALVPSNRIPTEVIQQIPSWLPYVRDIVVASHICRYWRAAFVSYPDLWTFLDCKSERATQVFLQRSRLAPLDICIRPGYSVAAFSHTLPHLQRWASFDVTVLPNEIVPLLAPLSAPGPAPKKLYNLSLIPMMGYGGDLVSLKGEILGGAIPSLRCLSLSNLDVDIHKLTAPNLTQLFLAATRSEFFDMTTLLDFLEHTPLLEDFELRYPGPNVDALHPDHVVSLTRLRRIVLWDRGSMFLNHLVLPHGIECELNYLFADISQTVGFFEEVFGRPPKMLKQIFQAESLSIVPHYAHGSVRFMGSSGLVEIFPAFLYAEVTPITRFIVYPPSLLKSVKTLYVGSRDGMIPEWKSTDLRRFLDKMTSLTSLTVMRCNHPSFIQVLLPTKGKVPCPTLRNLTIHVGPIDHFNIPSFRLMVGRRESLGYKFERMVLVLSYERRVEPAIPNLEVKVDDRALFWDSKKKLWRYLNEGEVYWDGDRTLAPPGIIPANLTPVPAGLHFHI